MKTLRPHLGCALLLAALLFSAPVASAQEDGFLTLTADSLGSETAVQIAWSIGYWPDYHPESLPMVGKWRYHPGDNQAWADPHYDDREWELAYTWTDPIIAWRDPVRFAPDFPGVGWFRLHLRVDSSLHQTPLGLSLWRGAATEVYLDGKLIHTVGQVGYSADEEKPFWDHELTSIRFRSDTTHVLAVRFSNFTSAAAIRSGFRAGFLIVLSRYEETLESRPHLLLWTTFHYALLAGILLALAFLHSILFAFYPKAKTNLYFAGVVIGWAGVLLFGNPLPLPSSLGDDWLKFRLLYISALFYAVFLLRFAYAVLQKRAPRYFYVLAAVGVALSLGMWFSGSFRMYLLALGAVASLDAVRVLVIGMLRKSKGAWIISVGLIPMVLEAVHISLVDLRVILPLWDWYAVPVYGYVGLCLVLSMSVYLARDFAQTKRGLERAHRELEDYGRTLEHKVETRTAELRAEKEKTEQQARRLQDLDRAKSRFFANVSHEFRTPLTLILGPTESALQGTHGPLPQPLRRQLKRTRHHARRLLRLVGQLLDLASLESGKLTLHRQPADLAAFLRRITRAFTPLAERERLTLSFRSDVRALPWVFDAEKLEQVVANLLSNALKFTPEGGKVWVTLTTSPGNGEAASEETPAVEIVVKDTGPGIAAADLERIFDRFEQVDGSATRAHEGTGIGLSLARELVELHGGRLLVRSEEGFGSAFIVRLPFGPDEGDPTPESAAAGDGVAERAADAVTLEAASASVEETSGAPADVSSARTDVSPVDAPVILVVEDNADVRAFLREELEAHYRVVEAADGEAGLEAARQHAPALVLSDVMMPRMDGYTLCRKLKADERLRHVPVVLLTAKAAEEDALEGLACGADDYLAKPFSAEALKARVANLIGSRRQLRAQFSREVVVQPSGVVVASDEEAFLNRVLHVIEDQMEESEFGVEALAEAVGVSGRQLRRRVKAVTGESPGALVRRMRLERAAQFLEAGAGTVAEVGYRVGFESASHFSKAFRAHFGHAPTDHAAERTQGSENRTGPP